jgi:hypothetical protein
MAVIGLRIMAWRSFDTLRHLGGQLTHEAKLGALREGLGRRENALLPDNLVDVMADTRGVTIVTVSGSYEKHDLMEHASDMFNDRDNLLSTVATTSQGGLCTTIPTRDPSLSMGLHAIMPVVKVTMPGGATPPQSISLKDLKARSDIHTTTMGYPRRSNSQARFPTRDRIILIVDEDHLDANHFRELFTIPTATYPACLVNTCIEAFGIMPWNSTPATTSSFAQLLREITEQSLR